MESKISTLFANFKQFIVQNDKELAFKPSNEKNFDVKALVELFDNLNCDNGATEDDVARVFDFIEISKYIHDMYVQMYELVKSDFSSLNLKGKEIVEYFVATQNREYKVIMDKRQSAFQKAKQGDYFISDLLNFKIQSADKRYGYLDARACLEGYTDTLGLLLNYLRFFLDEDMNDSNANPETFAGYILHSFNVSSSAVVIKRAYDDILYNRGAISIDKDEKQVLFDFDSNEDLMLLRAGDMMFPERKIYIHSQMLSSGSTPRLYRYVTNYRIKKAKITDGIIELSFGQGEPKQHKEIVADIQSAIDSFYEFLDGNTLLPKTNNITIDEAISVWATIQYIALYVSENINFDVALFRKEDYAKVPRKIKKTDLLNYVAKLTGLQREKVSSAMSLLTVNWKSFNDIWSTMLYPVDDYYIPPFYPLIYSAPYNVIDMMLKKGGVDLDERGTQFEKYLNGKLKTERNVYPISLLSTGKHGVDGDEEEIDLLIGMKNVVLIAEAKCVHYSMEPSNYADARKRLEHGCEQALKKAGFVKSHPDYFGQLGDYSAKTIIPLVITNYPTFTGFSHKGVYVIDSHSFLAYIQGGYMTMRQLNLQNDPIIGLVKFFNNEDEFSDNFFKYLTTNPIKNEFKKRITIYNQPMLILDESWKFVCKTAQLMNDPQFNISNDDTREFS